MRYLYLHGFASGPSSRKACYFAGRFEERGFRLETPELTPSESEGGFEALTISGQLRMIERMVGEEPCVLMGSSMGGYLAAIYASTHASVERVVLLAPAFCLAGRWREAWADKIGDWQRQGWLEVFHYGKGGEARVGYELLADADGYPDYPSMSQPALIFHGLHDPIVPVDYAREFHRRTAQSRLIEYNSGHELTDCLEPMWAETASFLGLTGRLA